MRLVGLLIPSLRRPIRRLVERIESRAFSGGLVFGDPKWRRVLFGIWAWRLVSRAIRRQPERLSVERLGAGQSVVVRVLGRNER